MQVNVVGLGYIGLPTAVMLASHGISVIGTDQNLELVSCLKKGEIITIEKGIESLFKNIDSSMLTFTAYCIKAEIYIIAVPTPYNEVSKKTDIVFLLDALKNILEVCSKGAVIVVESTIAPGTIHNYLYPVVKEYGYEPEKDLYLAHAPERIMPSNILNELQNNSRVIGVASYNIGYVLKNLYSSFCHGEIVLTDICTAEMSKVVENTYRDINIAFANELARICHQGGLDVYKIIEIANKHPRVNVLQPGPGVGGHCISVDPWFLVGDYPDEANLIRVARTVNDDMPAYIFERIIAIMKENYIVELSHVGLYGLTYKENVNDIRNSPTLQLLSYAYKKTLKNFSVYDPYITTKLVDNQFFQFDTFLDEVDLVVIMVKHNEILSLIGDLQGKVVFDTQNICHDGLIYKL